MRTEVRDPATWRGWDGKVGAWRVVCEVDQTCFFASRAHARLCSPRCRKAAQRKREEPERERRRLLERAHEERERAAELAADADRVNEAAQRRAAELVEQGQRRADELRDQAAQARAHAYKLEADARGIETRVTEAGAWTPGEADAGP